MQHNSTYSVNHGSTRTVVQVPIAGDPALINQSLEQLLTKEGYAVKPYSRKGIQETVWKKGTGFLTAMKFIRLDYQPNMLVISGWVAAGMGSASMEEMPLKGILAAAPKKSCLKTVEKVAQLAQSMAAQK